MAVAPVPGLAPMMPGTVQHQRAPVAHAHQMPGASAPAPVPAASVGTKNYQSSYSKAPSNTVVKLESREPVYPTPPRVRLKARLSYASGPPINICGLQELVGKRKIQELVQQMGANEVVDGEVEKVHTF